MATRDIYESGFDEDVRAESSANQCPECNGRVTTNAVETVYEDCGLVINEQRIDHGPEWRAYDDEERGVTTGVHPAGFAAACLYKAGQEQGQWVTQSDVAETGNVTPTTVRTHHETLDDLAV